MPQLDAVTRGWLQELAVESEAINLNDVAETTGPTDGNVRISFHVEHQLVAKNEKKARAAFESLLGEATCHRIDIDEADEGTFEVEADVILDLDLPLEAHLNRDSPVEALQAAYETAQAEYAKRFHFDEMDELNVEVLNADGNVLDIVVNP